MKIKKTLPPVYDRILKAGMKPNPGTIYTYGDTIYNPDGIKIPEYLLKHEETHCRQQGKKIEEWWDKYLKNKMFRLDQEIEAYRVQYKFMCQSIIDRNKRNRVLVDIALSLSGEMYGKIVSTNDAINLIKK